MKSNIALLSTTMVFTAAMVAGCTAPDNTDADHESGDENVGEAQGAVTSQTLPDFFASRQNKPPISYGRGAGTALEGLCPSDKHNEAGLCYTACPEGSVGVGTVCWVGINPVATRAVGTVPIGYGCPSDKEEQDLLCYSPCALGYHGVGPVCWLDTIDRSLCEALYSPTTAAWAKYDHRTRTFGLGAGMAIGASVSGEAGVYYGENGEYGCYTSTCYGVVTDISVEVSASFGDFQSLAALKGDGGFDLSVGVGYGVGGYTQSYAFDGNNQVVGFVQQTSLGVGLSPIALGISSCDTSYTDILAAPPQAPPGNTFYIVSGDGQLLRSHVNADNSFDAVNQAIGSGWGGNTKVFAADGGYIYLITQGGDLRLYHHLAAGGWDNGGVTIGTDWNVFRTVFAAGFGKIYAVKNNGDLVYYQHDAANQFQAPVTVGTEWNFPTIFSGGGNVVYAIDGSGHLIHYARRVEGGWDAPVQIGTGWNGFAGVGSMGNGEIYAMTNDGRILRYKHDPSFNWVVQGQQIGTGFSIYTHGLITDVH